MITNETVLILGAGASSDFQYPLGYQLLQKICNQIGNSDIVKFFLELGFTKDIILKFRDALFYSGKYSVDAFLEHRKEFIDVGKAAIAYALIPYEITNNLFNEGDNWYKYLYNKLNTSLDEFHLNKIAIKTYNYDRSLEHYLYTTLKNSYGITDNECAEKLKSIPIIHLHGCLGYLPWQKSENYREYSNVLSVDNIKISSKMIKIIHEDISKDNEFTIANELIKKAKRVYFLGFGYNTTNLKRLNLTGGKSIFGTGVGMTHMEMQSITSKFPINIQMHVDNIGLLKDYAPLD